MRPETILGPLKEAVQGACVREQVVALAFSGGLDSSIIAVLARESAEVHTYTVGYPSTQDLRNAQEASEALDLSWRPIRLNDRALLRDAKALIERFPSLDPVSFSFELPLWILMRKCAERVILSGQGADELFGGYARYMDMEVESLRRAMDVDLQRLLTATLPREDKMARIQGKELRVPYCHAKVISTALSLPPQVRRGESRKEVLRKVAEMLGLPASLVERPKRAVQYGSGVMKALKAMAKSEGKGLGDFILDLGRAK